MKWAILNTPQPGCTKGTIRLDRKESTVSSKIEICSRCRKTVDQLAAKCDRMLGYDYMGRHNEVVRCLHLMMCKKYRFKETKVSNSLSTIVHDQYNADFRVDTRVAIDVK
ncbi:hypothetical protein NGRA_0416 [Nosema granulosis]|uniref:Uncharacterized protein n=1 Tax=Nosema granulosis TaxID=83296 RepID=A0A9P6H3L3_9MICR|nr:hypothetical protein NGRA_0416 [Nosema granulosis]